MAAVPSDELRAILWMFVILLAANFKFRNRSTCSKGPVKRAGKVCGDSQDLKSPGLQSQIKFCFPMTIAIVAKCATPQMPQNLLRNTYLYSQIKKILECFLKTRKINLLGKIFLSLLQENWLELRTYLKTRLIFFVIKKSFLCKKYFLFQENCSYFETNY